MIEAIGNLTAGGVPSTIADATVPSLPTDAAAPLQSLTPLDIIEQAMELARRTKLPGALFTPEVSNALSDLHRTDLAAYANIRASIKSLRQDGVEVQMADFDKLILRDPEPESTPESLSDKLLELARQHCTLAHDKDGRPLAFIDINAVRQVWYCDTSGFHAWLSGLYYATYRKGLGQSTIATAVSTLQAIGIHEGEQVTVFQRIGKSGPSYILDMGDDDWSVIVLEATGWHITKPAPIAMTRSNNARALPRPMRQGDVALLWKYANIKPNDRPLILAWLLESLRSDTPFPVLELIGEQGTAKSSTQKALIRLIDPSKVLLRNRPKSVEDIFVAANNSHIVSYENLSGLSDEQQDALCVLATGGAFASRKLYTNMEESSVALARPVVLNGIAACATRPDLIQRTIQVEPPAISQKTRREQAELEAAWERDYPAIFGGLLDLAVATFRALPSVQLQERERMADFQRLGEAMTRAMGHPASTFISLYAANVRGGVERVLESDPVAMAICNFVDNQSFDREWRGTVGRLYTILSNARTHNHAGFPKSSKGLSDQIRRIAPALRQIGISVAMSDRTREGRQVVITRAQPEDNIGNPPSPPSQASPQPEVCDGGDGGDGPSLSFTRDKEKVTVEI